MTSILETIRALYGDMGRGEKKIADWILANPQDIINLSISELAAACGSGEATIFRFSKRLGLNGYQSLKISIAQETAVFPAGDVTIGPDDDCFSIFAKRSMDITTALENTKGVLSAEDLSKAADIVASANRIVIFGLGNSSSVALDAQHKFLRAGLNAAAYCDNHMQAIAACHLRPGDAAIGISHSGSSIDIVEALRLSRKAGAATICITNYGVSPITRVSDIKLFTKAEETKYTILAMSSRIAQLCIIDSIYTYIVFHSDASAISAIQETERALQSKKY